MKVGKVEKYIFDKKQSHLLITMGQFYAIFAVPFLLIPVVIIWFIGPFGIGKVSHIIFWPVFLFCDLLVLMCLMAAFVRSKYVITSDKLLWRDKKKKVYNVELTELSEWAVSRKVLMGDEMGDSEIYKLTIATKDGKKLPFTFTFSNKENCQAFIGLIEKHTGLKLPIKK